MIKQLQNWRAYNMTWHTVGHDKVQAISKTEKQMFFEKLHTVSQDLIHVCQSTVQVSNVLL
jgi:hypothetical protein